MVQNPNLKPGKSKNTRSTAREFFEKLQADPGSESLQKEFDQLVEDQPELATEVLKLAGAPVEIPEDIDEDALSRSEKNQETALDKTSVGTRGTRGEPYKRRHQWSNWLKTTEKEPLRYYTPESLFEIQEIIRQAEGSRRKVRAFGSGHGLSDIAATSDYMVDTSKLQRVLPIPTLQLKDEHQEAHLFHVEAGIKIKRLNRKLKEEGLALINMGGSDVQSVIGAISTSTHGSGITLGPLPSMVRSLVLVTSNGDTYRIEPTDGITDPNRYDEGYLDIQLIQDDAIFNSVVVSMGCMGIIYSLIIEVVPAYLLSETRKIYKWSELKPLLQKGDHELIRSHRHFELLVNPHKTKGDHTCMVTTRDFHDSLEGLKKKDRHRDFLPSLVSKLKIAPSLFVSYFNLVPNKIPKLIDTALKGLADDQFANDSYKVLNQGSGQLKFIGCAVELGFSMDAYIDAIEKIFKMADRFRAEKQHLTSPFGVRFVAKSDACLSMMNKGETCMIEVPTLKGTPGWQDLTKNIQMELAQMGGVPHWGLDFAQVNGNNFDHLESMYPEIKTWLKVFEKFNCNGTFNNSFTDRMGFSQFGASFPIVM